MGAMGESSGGVDRGRAAEQLILRTIAAHAESVLRTARRHSMCVDDAQDAYQRAIELFMSHASRLDAARAPGWLHVVVKREALAIQRARRKILMSTEVDLDGHEARTLPTPEEQLLSFDLISRSAEALKRLRPHELRALWLRAQGHSYSEIGAITGWSYTKVNRCVSEGRRIPRAVRGHRVRRGVSSAGCPCCRRWSMARRRRSRCSSCVRICATVRGAGRRCGRCRTVRRRWRRCCRCRWWLGSRAWVIRSCSSCSGRIRGSRGACTSARSTR